MATEIALVHVYHVFLGLSYADMRVRRDLFLEDVESFLSPST